MGQPPVGAELTGTDAIAIERAWTCFMLCLLQQSMGYTFE